MKCTLWVCSDRPWLRSGSTDWLREQFRVWPCTAVDESAWRGVPVSCEDGRLVQDRFQRVQRLPSRDMNQALSAASRVLEQFRLQVR